MWWTKYSQTLFKWRAIKLCWNEAADHLLLPHIKFFLRNKKRSGTSLPVYFSGWFLKKSIYLVILYYFTKFHCLVVFISWGIGQYMYRDCLLTKLWCHDFKINLILLIKLFFLYSKKFITKTKTPSEKKSF